MMSRGMVPATSTLSMREKSQLKRRINQEHNCNFRAGYIEVNEEYLHKTGIRGRKRYLFYCVVFTLIFLALLNALVTAGLVYFLGISHLGINDLEFLPGQGLLRVFADTEFNKIKMYESRIGGRYNKNLKIAGMEGAIVVQAPYDNGTRVVLYDKKISLTTDNFQITDKNGTVLLTTSARSTYPLKQSNNLHATAVQASMVRSRAQYPDLVIESHNAIKVSGSEGVEINSRQGIVLSPNRFLKLNSTAGGVTFDPKQFLYLSKNLPLASPVDINQSQSNNLSNGTNSTSQSASPLVFNQSQQAYKLCVCITTGKLFAVKVTDSLIGCKNIQSDFNPCY